MLELKNLRKSFGRSEVLKDITLDVRDGEIVSVLGPSGCGKTTLLNTILGITELSGGKILFNGEDISSKPMQQRGFNIVFQDYALFPNLNAYKNITYGLRNNPSISTREEVEELIDLLDLRPHLQKSIGELSGGQKQRVALARTLAVKPRLLLLDEPLLKELPGGCLYVELASVPGAEICAAQQLGVRCIRAAGLPGQLVPATAAEAIREAVYQMILEERGDPV